MDYKKGLKNLLEVPLTPEEIKSEELDQFYKDNIEGKKYTPGPIVDLSPFEQLKNDPEMQKHKVSADHYGKEPRNQFGHTAAQKTKMVEEHLTRPTNSKKIRHDRKNESVSKILTKEGNRK